MQSLYLYSDICQCNTNEDMLTKQFDNSYFLRYFHYNYKLPVWKRFHILGMVNNAYAKANTIAGLVWSIIMSAKSISAK